MSMVHQARRRAVRRPRIAAAAAAAVRDSIAQIEPLEQRLLLSASMIGHAFRRMEGTSVSPAHAATDVLSGTGVLLGGIEPATINSTIARFTDTDVTMPLTGFTATINWGDGTLTSGKITGGSGNFDVSGSHIYPQDGIYHPLVSLSEKSPGTATTAATATVTVQEFSLGITPSGIIATENSAFSGVVARVSDPGGTDPASALAATINWGDGTASAGIVSGGGGQYAVSGTHIYGDEGRHTATVTAWESDTPDFIISVPDIAIIADSDVLAGTGVSLTGIEQTPTSGTLATFSDANTTSPASDFVAAIDWGDGTTTAGTVSGGSGSFAVSGTHTYGDDGTYSPIVKLSEAAPGTASATTSATIAVQEFTLGITPSGITALENSVFNGVVAHLSDPGSADLASEFNATINWGDGTITSGTITGSGGDYTISGTHTYADEGSYGATVTAWESGSPRLAITIRDTAAIVEADVLMGTGASLGGVEPATINGTLARFTDSDALTPLSDFAASINWGDGASSSGILSGGPGNIDVSGTHLYRDDGVYQPQVRLWEISPGTASATATATVTVAESSLGITPAGVIATENSAFTGIVASISDPGSTDPASNFAATIDWGDGTASPGILTGSAGVYVIHGTHTYVDEGRYTATVTAWESGTPDFTIFVHDIASVADADVLAGAGASLSGIEQQTLHGTLALFKDTNTAAPLSDFTAAIDWGDGTTTAGLMSGGLGIFDVSGVHTYADDGIYSPQVSLSEKAPGTAVASARATITVAESSLGITPAGIIATENSAFTGIVVSVSDPGSAAPASNFAATIDWGDGTSSAGILTGSGGIYAVHGTHTYVDEGRYTATVTAWEKDTPDFTISVHDIASVADADVLAGTGTSLSGIEQQTLHGTLALFKDTNTAAPLSDFTATIDWGDGTTTAGLMSGGSGTFDVSGVHTYADDGTYTPLVSLSENAPGTAVASARATITVAESSLGITPSGIIATENSAFTGIVASVSDPGSAAPAANFAATINWGDGTSSAGILTGSGGVYAVHGTHTYLDEGRYTATVTAWESDTPEFTIPVHDIAMISDPAVAATGGLTIAATEGVSTGPVIVARFTDPAGPELQGDYSASIDWGDGSQSNGTIVANSDGSFSVVGAHTYAIGLGAPAEYGSSLGQATPPVYPRPIITTISHGSTPPATAASQAAISTPLGTALSADGNLVVIGTSGNDRIVIDSAGRHGDQVDVRLNGHVLGPFSVAPTGRIIVDGLAGDDVILVSKDVRIPTALFGGPGDDFIRGGGGHNIELGGDGNDTLIGGKEDDLLIGGAGADLLIGGGDKDVLAGGITTNDYATLLADLANPALLNGQVADDGALDTLIGSFSDTFIAGNQPKDIIVTHGGKHKRR